MLAPKTLLLIPHIVGVVFGVGGVLMLDVNMLKYLFGQKVSNQDIALTRYVSRFVKFGLIAVWTSGLIIISIAPDGVAATLANPKLQAKIVIVVVLTINAIFIETIGLPLLYAQLGQTLFFRVGIVQRAVVLVSGVVSTVSWCLPVLLGLAREWSFKIPAHTILSLYAATLAMASVTIVTGSYLLTRPRARRQASSDTPVVDVQTNLDLVRETLARYSAQRARDGVPSENEITYAEAVDFFARRSGRASLDGSLTHCQAEYAGLATEVEKRSFRTGLFAAMLDRLGSNASEAEFAAAVAADKDLREKFALVAPDAEGTDAFANLMESAEAHWSTDTRPPAREAAANVSQANGMDLWGGIREELAQSPVLRFA